MSKKQHSHHGIEGFETWVEAVPSFYLIRPEPNRNYGVSNVRLVFYLKGEKGAVQWMIGTEWGIKPTREHLAQFGFNKYDDPRQPKGWDLGYHAFEPQYEGQSVQADSCPVLDGKPCFYDGSVLDAELLVEGFLAEGTDWLWQRLAEVYRHQFEGGHWPSLAFEYRKHPQEQVAPAEKGVTDAD